MKKNIITAVFITIIIIASFVLFSNRSYIDPTHIKDFLSHCGKLAPFMFVCIFAIAPVVFVPITPLCIMSGFIFGPIAGTIFALIGSTFGASNAFLISRYLIKDWVDEKTPKQFDIVKQNTSKHGWKFLALCRITPVVPFNFQNYLFGVSDISLRTFVIVSILGMLPGTFAYVYLGYAGKNIFSGGSQNITEYSIIALLIIIAAITPKFIKKLKGTIY